MLWEFPQSEYRRDRRGWSVTRKIRSKAPIKLAHNILGVGIESALSARLEHVPKKLIAFFDQNMLQLIDVERVLIDWMIPSNRNAL